MLAALFFGTKMKIKNYASTIYESLLTVCLFFLKSILSDFERSLGFFTLGVGGGV